MSGEVELETADRLRGASFRIARNLRQIRAEVDFTITETTILASVVRNGPVGLSQLADDEGMNPTMLSRVVRRLEKSGLVVRSKSPLDARAGVVSATAAGKRLFQRMRSERNDSLNRLVNQLDADSRRALVEALPVLELLANELKAQRS